MFGRKLRWFSQLKTCAALLALLGLCGCQSPNNRSHSAIGLEDPDVDVPHPQNYPRISDSSAREAERFILTLQVAQPPKKDTPLRLLIELKNISAEPQRITTFTNFFSGMIYLKTAEGNTNEFMNNFYQRLRLTATYITPRMEIPPGGSYRWEHSLAEFTLNHYTSKSAPTLLDEFQAGTKIWCSFAIHRDKQLDESSHFTTVTTATITSDAVQYPEK